MMNMELSKLLTVFIFLQICRNVICIQTYYMSDKCGETISIISKKQIRIKSVSYGNYDSDENCNVTICASLSERMSISFNALNIEDSDDCKSDNLTIYDGQLWSFEPTPSKIGKPKFCGYTTPSTIYESTGDYITLSFRSDSSVETTGFEVIVTQFHEGYCWSWETECDNGKCISDSLTCNGYDPCGDGSDCDVHNLAIIIGATVGGVVFLGIAITIGVCVYCMCFRSRNGNRGYLANPIPMTTTPTTSANMTTNFGSPYSNPPPPPPGYNPNAYGMGTVPQQQPQQQQQTTATPVTGTQQYPKL